MGRVGLGQMGQVDRIRVEEFHQFN